MRKLRRRAARAMRRTMQMMPAARSRGPRMERMWKHFLFGSASDASAQMMRAGAVSPIALEWPTADAGLAESSPSEYASVEYTAAPLEALAT